MPFNTKLLAYSENNPTTFKTTIPQAMKKGEFSARISSVECHAKAFEKTYRGSYEFKLTMLDGSGEIILKAEWGDNNEFDIQQFLWAALDTETGFISSPDEAEVYMGGLPGRELRVVLVEDGTDMDRDNWRGLKILCFLPKRKN